MRAPQYRLLIFGALTAIAKPVGAQSIDSAPVGSIHFEISCKASQGAFDRAVALLHNFFFPETVKAFQAIIEREPNCAMAYWGLAMSERPNPLVPPFPRANLKAGWEAIQLGKKAKMQTPREAKYLRAMEAFYQDYDTTAQSARTRNYGEAMRRLHVQYPNDPEAAIFYALALNEGVDFKDTSFKRQLEAATILEAQARKQPNHPGIAHYLIHSYDFAPIAAQGLTSAHHYSSIAAQAPHALHMPSHTYSMLGMWQDSILANRAAQSASVAYAAKNFPDATDPTLPHLLDFLVYAYLQLGKDNEAEQIVWSLRDLKKFASLRLSVDTALAAIPARFALERGRWNDAAHLPVRESQYPQAQSISHFARALGAARAGNLDTAAVEISRLVEIEQRLAAAKDEYWAGQTSIQIEAASAWVLLKNGQPSAAIIKMSDAADLDDASIKNVAMENKLLPMRELLGEIYLSAGDSMEALAQFKRSLKSSPNRFRSLAGSALAARAVGKSDEAKSFYEALLTLTRDSDGGRAELSEARSYLANN